MIKSVDTDNETVVVTLIRITSVCTLKRIKEIMSSAELFTEIDFKFYIEKQRTYHTQSDFEKKSWKITLADFRIYYKAT